MKMPYVPRDIWLAIFEHLLADKGPPAAATTDPELLLRQPYTRARPYSSLLSHPCARLTPEKGLGKVMKAPLKRLMMNVWRFGAVNREWREVVKLFRGRLLSIDVRLLEDHPRSRIIAPPGARHLEFFSSPRPRPPPPPPPVQNTRTHMVQAMQKNNFQQRLHGQVARGYLQQQRAAPAQPYMPNFMPPPPQQQRKIRRLDQDERRERMEEIARFTGATLTSLALEESTLRWLPEVLLALPTGPEQLLSLFIYFNSHKTHERITEELRECIGLREVSIYNAPEPMELLEALSEMKDLRHLQVISEVEEGAVNLLVPAFVGELVSLDLGYVGLTVDQGLAFASQFNDTLDFLSLDGLINLLPPPDSRNYKPTGDDITRYPRLEYLMVGVAALSPKPTELWTAVPALEELLFNSPKLERLMLDNILLFAEMDQGGSHYSVAPDKMAEMDDDEDPLFRIDERISFGGIKAAGFKYDIPGVNEVLQLGPGATVRFEGRTGFGQDNGRPRKVEMVNLRRAIEVLGERWKDLGKEVWWDATSSACDKLSSCRREPRQDTDEKILAWTHLHFLRVALKCVALLLVSVELVASTSTM